MILLTRKTRVGVVIVETKIEWRDAWIGMFFDANQYVGFHGAMTRDLHVYVCPLPFCLLHLRLRQVLNDAGQWKGPS